MMITMIPHYVVSLPYCHITITLPLPSEVIAIIPIRVMVIALLLVIIENQGFEGPHGYDRHFLYDLELVL